MKNKIVNNSILAIFYYAEIGKPYEDTAQGRQDATNAFRNLRLRKTIRPEALRRAKERYLEVVKRELELEMN